MQTDVDAYFEAKRAQDPWDALKQSTDRLVAYIAEHAPGHYRTEAESVLRELPPNATVEQLRQVARNAGIGHAHQFEQFVAQAQAAGVFGDSPSNPSAGQRAALEAWARQVGRGVVTDRHITELFRHVDAIVAAESGADSDGDVNDREDDTDEDDDED